MKRLQFCSYLAPSMLSVYELVTEEVGRRTGLETELVIKASYDSLERDESEVCFVCSLPYVTLERRGLDVAAPVAAPVLIGDRYAGRPVYFSDVIVHRDAPIRSFLDLRGHSWAYNEALSHSGYGVTRYHMVGLGETEGFFGDVIEAGFHEEAIRMVACGEVDASAIDSQVLAIAMRDDAGLAERLRVVEVLGPSTIQPVAVSRRVPDDLRDAIRDVLVTMADDAAVRAQLAVGLVERFAPVVRGILRRHPHDGRRVRAGRVRRAPVSATEMLLPSPAAPLRACIRPKSSFRAINVAGIPYRALRMRP